MWLRYLLMHLYGLLLMLLSGLSVYDISVVLRHVAEVSPHASIWSPHASLWSQCASTDSHTVHPNSVELKFVSFDDVDM